MLHLKVKDMKISTGDVLIVIVNKKDAELLDLHALDRIKIFKGNKVETVIVDIAESKTAIPQGKIGLFGEVVKSLNAKTGDDVRVDLARKPTSLDYIKKKLDGFTLTRDEIKQIVWDIVHNKLTSIELTYFVSAVYSRKMSLQETTWLTKAMADEGESLRFQKRPVMDKHCVGGVAGNRTTPIVVPIIAAAGLTIPKTSSRSITSPAGTADTMEVLMDVDISLKKMEKVVKKTGGCLVWGGSLNLAPADDKIIRVERPLSIDAKSQLLASVMAKKASVGATHVLVDIPYGKGSKVESLQRANTLKSDFESVGKSLGIKVKVILTDGRYPIGKGIGPALEARDILWVLKNDKRAPQDLLKKSINLAGEMLEMAGKAKKGKGAEMALEILKSGKAYKKMVEIINAQGKKITEPGRVRIGRNFYEIKAGKSGKLVDISNADVSKIARVAGAPKDIGAGICLFKNVGDKVVKGEVLAKIHAESKQKLKFAVAVLKEIDGFVVK
jgi:AMP phosphorylase